MRNVLKLTILCLLALGNVCVFGQPSFDGLASLWNETVPIRFGQMMHGGVINETTKDFLISPGANTEVRYSVANPNPTLYSFRFVKEMMPGAGTPNPWAIENVPYTGNVGGAGQAGGFFTLYITALRDPCLLAVPPTPTIVTVELLENGTVIDTRRVIPQCSRTTPNPPNPPTPPNPPNPPTPPNPTSPPLTSMPKPNAIVGWSRWAIGLRGNKPPPPVVAIPIANNRPVLQRRNAIRRMLRSGVRPF